MSRHPRGPQQVKRICFTVQTLSPKPSNPALPLVRQFTSSQSLLSWSGLCKGDRGIDTLGYCSGQDVT